MKKFREYFDCVPSLETDRFLLVPFAREDMDEYFDILRDDRVQRYLGGGVPLFDKEPNITDWLHNINDRLLKRKLVFTWCVKEKATGRVIGRIDLGGFVKQTMAEIAYHYAYHSWGQGVATEVAERVTDFGLNELGLQRIQGVVHIENEASMHVLEKNGYLREGTLHYYPFGKEFYDVVMLAIVKRRLIF
ncbi:MAG: GNAT family N-acetyltransferase [Ruminococcus flavefaciens]|nr:GNAT family N-acetyltransferase [Ruminococcus flavefaciens]